MIQTQSIIQLIYFQSLHLFFKNLILLFIILTIFPVFFLPFPRSLPHLLLLLLKSEESAPISQYVIPIFRPVRNKHLSTRFKDFTRLPSSNANLPSHLLSYESGMSSSITVPYPLQYHLTYDLLHLYISLILIL